MQGFQCNVHSIRYQERIDDDYVKACSESLDMSHVTKGLPSCIYKTVLSWPLMSSKHTRPA